MCPKSYITAESQSLIEEFFVWRRLRPLAGEELSARQVEAFVILERELAMEVNGGSGARDVVSDIFPNGNFSSA
jgi:hypothetical protein